MSDAIRPARQAAAPGAECAEPEDGFGAPGVAHEPTPASAARARREKRLADALKANLKRRKAAKADRKEPG